MRSKFPGPGFVSLQVGTTPRDHLGARRHFASPSHLFSLPPHWPREAGHWAISLSFQLGIQPSGCLHVPPPHLTPPCFLSLSILGYQHEFGLYNLILDPSSEPSTAKAHLASAPHAHEVAEQALVHGSHQKQRKRSHFNARVCCTMDDYHVLS